MRFFQSIAVPDLRAARTIVSISTYLAATFISSLASLTLTSEAPEKVPEKQDIIALIETIPANC